MQSALRFFRGLAYSIWVVVLVLLTGYAGLVFVDVVTNQIEDDRAPAMLIALAVLDALTAIAALLVVVKLLRGRLSPGGFFAGTLLTCASLLFTLLIFVVALVGTGHS